MLAGDYETRAGGRKGEGQLLTLERIESVFAQHDARLSAGSLTRMQLLDIATVLSCATSTMKRLIDEYREMAGTRSMAEQASATCARVTATMTWLGQHGQEAAEREVALRVSTAHAEAVRVLVLIRRMDMTQQEIHCISDVRLEYEA